MDPRLREYLLGRDKTDEVELILKIRRDAVVSSDIRIVTRFGDIATCRLQRDQIREIWEQENVISLKAPRLVAPEPEWIEDEAAEDIAFRTTDIRRPENLPHAGRGVVIGVVDWGCDFAHPNFRNEDGSTRLLALWDQSNTTPTVKADPYGYGVVYSRADINRALQSANPYSTLGYHPSKGDPFDDGAHGTHVLDIAAGNGRVPSSLMGIAPEAEIVFVHLAARGISGLANLGDSARVLEALDFVAKIAGNKPWVINLSMGRCGGPHTGLTLVEQGMDALLQQAPGRAIVQSTGNYFSERVHASGHLHPGEQRVLAWRTDKADLTPNELEVWYSGHDAFVVEVRPPEGELVFRVPLGEQRSIRIGDQEAGRIYHRARDPSNGDHHIDIFLYPTAPAGAWRITLVGEDVVDGRFHAWVERDSACRNCQSRFDPTDADPSATIGTICSGFRTIAVGAYNPHSTAREVAFFSSSGPTRDGRQKPDLIAPGVSILAARSAPREPQGNVSMLTRKSGSSMAAPHVTATIACMFEAAPRPLWIHETRRLLLSSARPVPASKENESRVGSGYLDIERAVEEARRVEDSSKQDKGLGVNTYARSYLILNDECCMRDQNNEELAMEIVNHKNFVLVSGGPGPYDDRDVEHDTSWANYVTAPLLLKNFVQSDEDVCWFIYRPAYERRWEEDVRSTNKNRKKAVEEVKARGFKSYVNLLEERAKQKGWKLVWLTTASGFWDELLSLDTPISRLWYWGHASDDLWLSVKHGPDGEAIEPDTHEIITVDSIRANSILRDKFQHENQNRPHRFIGCNTAEFAKTWSEIFKAWSEGVDGKIDFRSIHSTGGEPSLADAASRKIFAPSPEATVADVWDDNSSAVSSASADNIYEDWIGETSLEHFTESDYDQRIIAGDAGGDFDLGVQLVDIADQAITSHAFAHSSGNVLEEVLSQARLADRLSSSNSESLSKAAMLFDTFCYGKNHRLKETANKLFEVVARPGESLRENIQAGDIIVRRALGEGQLAHLALVTTGEMSQLEELQSTGLRPETRRPGLYVKVVESGAFPHRSQDDFARRLTDERGRLDLDQMILRIKLESPGSELRWSRSQIKNENFEAAADIDWNQAITLNRRYAVEFGWDFCLDRIAQTLGSKPYLNVDFAKAVAQWQEKQGLQSTGFIGPKSWERMRSKLGFLVFQPREIKPRDLKDYSQQLPEAIKYKAFIYEGAKQYGFQPAVIVGVGSRESRWGLGLKPKGPTGTGDWTPRNGRMPKDGGGWGRGLMQIDYRWHEFAKTGNWQYPKENILYGCSVLKAAYNDIQRKTNLDRVNLLRATLAAYNAGVGNVLKAINSGKDVDSSTAGGDYSKDVINRTGWFQLHGWV